MKEPVDHILRPQLPWRDAPSITECGYDASKVKTLTRSEFFDRLKELGKQRSAMLTCMTCAETATRWGTWEDDPRAVLERELQWEYRWRRTSERGQRLHDELLAIAALIAEHKDEFLGRVTATEQRRAWNEKKAAHKPRPQLIVPRTGL
jgi:hypothetical protein